MTAQTLIQGGAQVAAEAMPYHRHRRTECNTGRRDPGAWLSSLSLALPRGSVATL
jgi:hypothetical protein